MIIDLSSLSDVELGCLAHEVDRSLCVLVKVSPRKESELIENRMAKLTTKVWKSVVNSTLVSNLNKLVAKPFTSKSIGNFLKQFGLKLAAPLTDSQVKVLGNNLTSIWKIGKKLAAQETKTTFGFRSIDRKAIKAINRHQVFWIGDFYSDKLSERIRGVTEDVLLRQGFDHKQAGKELRTALQKEFGLTPGRKRSKFAPNIPARYAGNPDLYFQQLASTVGHQARTFGKMQQFKEHDVITYRLINPMDEVTGQICQQMHGKTFTIDAGMKQMKDVLNAKSPKDVKNVSKWLSADEIESKFDKGGAKALIDAGATIIPPFHPKCRTEPIVGKIR